MSQSGSILLQASPALNDISFCICVFLSGIYMTCMMAPGASMLPHALNSWWLCACPYVSAHVAMIHVQAMAVYSWTTSGNIALFKRLHGSPMHPATRRNESVPHLVLLSWWPDQATVQSFHACCSSSCSLCSHLFELLFGCLCYICVSLYADFEMM